MRIKELPKVYITDSFLLVNIIVIIWPIIIGLFKIAACQGNNSGSSYIDGLEQDCSNSFANALELKQSCS